MSSKPSKKLNEKASINSALPSNVKPLAAAIQAIIASIAFNGAATVHAGELPVPSAALATLGRADQVVSGNKMTINQYTNQAILNWQSFNIGKENTVQFKQPSASAVALNRIFQADPSRIFGKLTANGQVYLLNQNGFIFGRDSQVNVNTLVASTLDISDETFQRGVTKVINQDGRPALIGTGEVYRKDAQGNFILDANGNKQKISIQFLEGSRINTDKNGRIIAAAPEIRNAGTLQAPDGQILMVAASDKVYLQEASGDPALRGLIVEVQTGGEVTNVGSLISHRGNTTLMGFAVNQQGRISAKTTVSANGSIRLLAREGARVEKSSNGWLLQPGSTRREETRDDGLGKQARVTFGEGSQTLATPDLKSREKAVDGQDQLISRIEVMGQKIQVRNQALIQAKSGDISLTATDNPVEPLINGLRNKSEIAIDPGAVIDVSGVRDVKLPMARNIVTVELRSNELRDSPLQRNGILYAKKIRVDIRKGTPIADISGELDRIERTVAERSTTGGKVNLISEGAVNLSPNARIDLSGGSLFYRPGYVNTTQLIAPNGKTVDIGDADPNQRYIGIVGKISQTFKDWNQVNRFNRLGPAESGRYERGYLEGKSAGSLDIKGAVLALEGEINAIALNGVRQRSPELQAKGGTLSLDTTPFVDSQQSVVFGKPNPDQPPPVDPPLVFKGDEFLKAGLSSVKVATNGEVRIGQDASIAMVDGGRLDLTGTRLQMSGSIVAHSGAVHLNTRLGQEENLNGDLLLDATARIDTSGKWSNDRPAEGDGKSRFEKSPLWIDGGEVSLKGEGDVRLAKGSLIDVSGGAQRTLSREINPGDAGRISLNAAGLDGSDLATEATLLGYAVAGGRGGQLSLASDKIVIGSGASAAAAEITSPPKEEGAEIAVNDNALRMKPLVIDPGFFGQGGFQDYTLQSNKSGLYVENGARVELKVQNRILSEGEAASRSSGARLEDFSHTDRLPDISRPGGSLNLILSQTAQTVEKSANLVVGEGALLATDPGGKIHLQSDASVIVNGQLNAPAGTIDLRITPPSTVQAEQGFLADQGIRLGSTGSLLARGTDQRLTDELGVIRGKVLPGGNVSLTADRGFVATALGSVIDVSGTAAELDLPTRGGAGTLAYRREIVPSSGGSLQVTSAEGFLLQGQVNGHSGAGSGAAGADLTLELNNLNRNLPGQLNSGQINFPANPLLLSLSQWPNVSVPLLDQSEPLPKAYYGKGFISANQIESGGFSSVTLRTPNKIEINGNTTLATERSLDFDAPVIMAQSGADGAPGNLELKSRHVTMGSSLIRPGQYKPTDGDAWFFLDSASLDLRGEGVLQGFGYSKLNTAGDLRLVGVNTSDDQRDFKGEFLTTGSLDIVARQLYPTTLSDFRIGILDNPDAILSLHGTGVKPAKVLSAAGKITLEALYIVQAGAITAPLGEINLKAGENLTLAPGSVTSNSAKGSTIPFGRTQGGLEWIYPLGTQTLVFDAPPAKKLALEANRVRIEPGSIVDTRGGGRLSAFEFLPGPGGSYDRLDPTSEGYQGSYAVLPGYRGLAAPIDPLETPVSDLKSGDSVYLAGGGGLKAGRYVLLSAHYALLPGAYLVTPEPESVTALPGDRLSRADGATVVAGYRTVAGTAIRDAQWSAFAVEKGSRAKTRSEFSIDMANAFYQEKAAREESLATPFLPRDGGAIQISAKSELTLDGKVKADGLAKARGGAAGYRGRQIECRGSDGFRRDDRGRRQSVR
ncbi:MAG: filamentous hemagglutinin N-terminal domain-containing protein [Methylococcus sp.]